MSKRRGLIIPDAAAYPRRKECLAQSGSEAPPPQPGSNSLGTENYLFHCPSTAEVSRFI